MAFIGVWEWTTLLLSPVVNAFRSLALVEPQGSLQNFTPKASALMLLSSSKETLPEVGLRPTFCFEDPVAYFELTEPLKLRADQRQLP